MTEAIIIFGAATLIAGFIIVFDPEIIFGYLRGKLENPALLLTAIAVRLVLGALLILQSEFSRFPLVIEVVGWLSIAAALVFAMIGHQRFKRLMLWALTILMPYGRLGGVAAVAFGGFLVYSFI